MKIRTKRLRKASAIILSSILSVPRRVITSDAVNATDILLRLEQKIGLLDKASRYNSKKISPGSALACALVGFCAGKGQEVVVEGNKLKATLCICTSATIICDERLTN